VGSHACKALAKAGYNPVVYDDLSTGYAWAVKWGVLEQGRLSDKVRLSSVIEQYQPIAVLHFASLISVGESVQNPALYYNNNVVETLDLLDVMREYQINRIVFSSTAAVYGEPEQTPISEKHPKRPANPYGSTKWIIEQVLHDYGVAYGLQSVALRYFNAAGADPDGEIGEMHVPETHLIPLVLQVAAGMRDHINVFGSDYPTPDGTCVRDYIHVSDLADAHVAALQLLESTESPLTEAFNLGIGAGYSVKQIIETVRQVSNRKIVTCYEGRRAGDPPTLVADASLAKTRLGWTPQYGAIESQISHAWHWMQVGAKNL
jgi:UDP-glucose-4-epimerase GalE